MFTVTKVLAMLCVFLNNQGVIGKEGRLFPNRKSALCPNGVIYRKGCQLCFCIEEASGLVSTKCDSKYSSEEECTAVSLRAHCEPHRLLYNYNSECEGECSCNQARNITTCQNLPCDNTFLWFFGYYDEPDLALGTNFVQGGARTDEDASPRVDRRSLAERVKWARGMGQRRPRRVSRKMLTT